MNTDQVIYYPMSSLSGLILTAAMTALVAAPTQGCSEPPARDVTTADPFHAARRGELEIVLQHIARDPDLLNATNKTGWMLVHYAAFGNHPEVIEELVRRGVVVDARNKSGETPLHMTVQLGSDEAAAKLIELGADPKARTLHPSAPAQFAEGYSVLERAAERGHAKIAEMLLKRDAPLFHPTRTNLASALHHACMNMMAPKHERDPESKGNRKVIRLLMKHVEDVNLREFRKLTPLHYAAAFGAADTVEFLLENYKDFDLAARGWHGDTPLHLAVRSKWVTPTRVQPEDRARIIRCLLKHGAPMLENHDKHTPLDLARRTNNAKILAAFEKE